MRARAALLPGMLAVVLAGTSGTSASAKSLSGTRYALGFDGEMTTTWSVAPHETYSPDSYCWTASEAGQGKQTVTFRTTGSPTLTVSSDDPVAGPFFQILPLSRRSTPRHEAPGFGRAKLAREGSLLTTYSAKFNNPGSGCEPPPQPVPQDAGGCGTFDLPWDLQAQVTRGVMRLSVEVHVDREIVCPFFGVNLEGMRDANGSMPSSTKERVGNVRRTFRRRGAKLIVRGRQSWKSTGGDRDSLKVKTSVVWTLTLRRVR